MNLLRLKATSFRNLTALNIELSNGFNLIYGLNGSGKTSILESIHYLSLGRSFRTNLSNRVIQYQADSFSVFGVSMDETGATLAVGIEKFRQGKIRIKAGNDVTPTQAELARVLPLQLINPDSYSLLIDGPKLRREFIDWGVFHVEPHFFSLWQRFQRALKQRNASLQQAAPPAQTKAWDVEMVTSAQDLAQLRRDYLQKLTPLFFIILAELIELTDLTLEYHQGWEEGRNLVEVLESNFHRDLMQGYTQFGPQRADLVLKVQGSPVQDVLSRGEQKLVVLALRLAQGVLLRDLTGKCCIYLLDDISAELDSERRRYVVKYLAKLEAQVFATAVDQASLLELIDYKTTKMFHVEQGVVLGAEKFPPLYGHKDR